MSIYLVEICPGKSFQIETDVDNKIIRFERVPINSDLNMTNNPY